MVILEEEKTISIEQKEAIFFIYSLDIIYIYTIYEENNHF